MTTRTRSRAAAKSAGTRFETNIVNYFRDVLDDDRIERRAKNGAKDRGDITGLRLSQSLARNGRLVAELKDVVKLALGVWMNEAEIERGNDDAVATMVIHKRARYGCAGDQWVTMTVDDLLALLTGERPQR